MKLIAEAGTAYYATATGAVCITSAPSAIQGVLFQGSATGSCQFFAGVTATGSPISGSIRAYATTGAATANPAAWYPFPAVCASGFCVIVGGSLDPKLTIFWNPLG